VQALVEAADDLALVLERLRMLDAEFDGREEIMQWSVPGGKRPVSP